MSSRKNRQRSKIASHFPPRIEFLEQRALLSAGGAVFAPARLSRDDFPSSDVQGYTPDQVRKAYGFDQITLGDGAVPADGRGQTIAIVDPYNDPSVMADLAVFDNQFGISAPPNFTVVNQSGGQRLPRTDAGWAGEIATDVEWAHAIAPMANLLLVECNTDQTGDLMVGVNYARAQAGVSTLSLSWGGAEFSTQTMYDGDFATPAGHAGITFVAASGDNGVSGGAQWPASSPNVISVGGTVLTIDDSTGTYGSETSWASSSGGVSTIEPEPAWQRVVQQSGFREMPDVAFNADTNIGMALYDSVPFQGQVGWQTTNGTSVGTPEWAALVAIADQARAQKGQGSLDGVTQTLPLLYNLYGAPGTAAYNTYTQDFNDITTGDFGQIRGLPGVGYDIATGLGSPKVPPLISALTDAPASVLPTGPSAPQITGVIVKAPPATAIAGTDGFIKIRLSNSARTTFSGQLTLDLYASQSLSPAPGAMPISTLPIAQIRLAGRGTRILRIAFTYPSVQNATDDYLVASITTPGTGAVASEAATPSTVTIAPPFVDFNPVFSRQAIAVRPGFAGNTVVVIQNIGNVTATGNLSVNLYSSSDELLDTSDPQILNAPTRIIHLAAGHRLVFRLHFLAPANQNPGTYFILSSIIYNGVAQPNIGALGTI